MPQGTQEHPHDRRGVTFCHCTLTTTSNAYRWQLRRGFTKPQTGAQGMGVSLCESTTHTTRCKQRNATAYPCLHHRVWIPRAVKIQCNAAGRRKSQLEHMRTAIVSAHRWSNPAHTTATRQSWAMPLRHHTHHTHTASSLAQSNNSWLRKQHGNVAPAVPRQIDGIFGNLALQTKRLVTRGVKLSNSPKRHI